MPPTGTPTPHGETGATLSMRAAPGPAVRVLIVGDVPLYREGLAQILRAAAGFEVTGTSETLALRNGDLPAGDPDIALVDLTSGGGWEVIQAAGLACPVAKVVVLGVMETEAEVLPLVEAGAAGYVSNEGSSHDLIATLRSVGRGESLASPRIVAGLTRRIAALAARREASIVPPGLTSREREILALVEEGLSNKEIAGRLTIEVTTVKNHVHHILEKLHVARRGQAAALARHGAGSPRITGERFNAKTAPGSPAPARPAG